MQVYTSNCYGNALEQARAHDLGILVASTGATGWGPDKAWKGIPCALDNGAFQCWQRGFPFMERAFFKALEGCYAAGLSLDFIVCPDLVAQGQRSLKYSMEWATERLRGGNLALAVQDGVTPKDVSLFTPWHHFTHIFVGGTLDWKWQTAPQWVEFAHQHGIRCHIGRCGTLKNLRRALSCGADSVDSSSFARNNSWHILREFQNGHADLFDSSEDIDPFPLAQVGPIAAVEAALEI